MGRNKLKFEFDHTFVDSGNKPMNQPVEMFEFDGQSSNPTSHFKIPAHSFQFNLGPSI